MARHQEIRDELMAKAAQLRERVSKVQSHLREPGNPDWQERATELENDEVLESLDTQGRNELDHIERALRRMESGVYGVCEQCEEEIPVGRLRALPFTTTCVDCAD
ncbi:MAG: TraR/DksA family transcriptional regulator [Deltaproteobacteria bacterium]|nr:TraR/DksA family transcriptional regulator [Deltaproteobacteria bacterium]